MSSDHSRWQIPPAEEQSCGGQSGTGQKAGAAGEAEGGGASAMPDWEGMQKKLADQVQQGSGWGDMAGLMELEMDPALAGYLSEELIARSGSVEDRPAQSFLRGLAMGEVNSLAGWEQIKTQFRDQVRAPRMEAYQRTGKAITNMLAVCRKALAGQPHLEFLFHLITDSTAVLRILVSDDFPQFKELLTDISFDPQQTERELVEQVKEVWNVKEELE